MDKRVNQYRATKYNPACRDKNGLYQKDDWTDFSDIGKSFSGCILTADEFDRVENNYIMMCIDVWEKHGRPTLLINDVENYCPLSIPKTVSDNQNLSRIIKRILENQFWAK